jgi:hypothetical protein
LAEGVSRYPFEEQTLNSRGYGSQEMTMAANTTTQPAKPEKHLGAKEQVSRKPKTPNVAAQTSSVRSADDTDTCLKRVGLAEALREEGIDERKIARGYANTHNRLCDSTDKGDIKLFVDVLKENSRTLESTRAPDRRGAGDGPVTIVMRHSVPRPAR